MQPSSRPIAKAPSRRGRSPCARSRPHLEHFLRSPHSSSEGPKAGHIPADIKEATGIEPLQLLGQRHGVDVFSMGLLLSTKPGTIEDSTLISAYVHSGS
jgi:hypothetical protein